MNSGKRGRVPGRPDLVGEASLLFLQVGGIGEHDPQQARRRRGGERRAPEALADEPGEEAGVVDVRVGEDHGG